MRVVDGYIAGEGLLRAAMLGLFTVAEFHGGGEIAGGELVTAEHRRAEALWSRIKPALKQIAKGHEADLDQASVAQLVDNYQAHATYEEGTFLPLSQTILGRNASHMAALGLSLHMRHARPVIGYI